MKLSDTSLKVTNYRCFGESPQGFERILPVNLIIGRNNTGKSALLDIVSYATGRVGQWEREDWHQNRPPVVQMSFPADTDQVSLQWNQNWNPTAKRKLAGKRATTVVGREEKLLAIDGFEESELSGYKILAKLTHPLSYMKFLRVAAARDINPESMEGYKAGPDCLSSNGRGATSLMWLVTNDRAYDSAWIEEELRKELNAIVEPDAHFQRIDLQYDSSKSTWEVYLDEANKGRISLSRCGSGLKTIFLILLNILIWPRVQTPVVDLQACCFAVEEPENNLHPALQRRLIDWMVYQTKMHHFTLFLTSHSSAAIDMLAHEDSAQILRVTSDGISAEVETASDRQSHFSVLDELGARASDILLANGVIWVEGISDAIYIRTWIKRYCDEKDLTPPAEGSEFAFVEYGGSCLAHYEYLAKNLADIKAMELEALLPALSLSRNAFVIMDSDRASSAGLLAPRKQNVINAIGEPNVWVTYGREVENYLSAAVLSEAGHVKPLRRHDKFKDFPGSKRDFALKAATALQRTEGGNYTTDWKSYDLEDSIARLLHKINEWNR